MTSAKLTAKRLANMHVKSRRQDETARKNTRSPAEPTVNAIQPALNETPKSPELEATDGPYAETREQLGGILILEADDMAHAVALMSKHPGCPARNCSKQWANTTQRMN